VGCQRGRFPVAFGDEKTVSILREERRRAFLARVEIAAGSDGARDVALDSTGHPTTSWGSMLWEWLGASRRPRLKIWAELIVVLAAR
jgi:hypothetical protein